MVFQCLREKTKFLKALKFGSSVSKNTTFSFPQQIFFTPTLSPQWLLFLFQFSCFCTSRPTSLKPAQAPRLQLFSEFLENVFCHSPKAFSACCLAITESGTMGLTLLPQTGHRQSLAKVVDGLVNVQTDSEPPATMCYFYPHQHSKLRKQQFSNIGKHKALKCGIEKYPS